MSIVDDAGRELISTPVSQVYCFQSTTKETVKVLDVRKIAFGMLMMLMLLASNHVLPSWFTIN